MIQYLFLLAFFTWQYYTSLNQKVKCLICDDVLIENHSFLIIFKCSKTNQFGSRIHKIPLPEIVCSPLCMVTAYKNMCCRIRVTDDQPAFCMLKASGISPGTYHDLQWVLRVQVAKLGLNRLNYSSHSFRRGSASLARVDVNLIQVSDLFVCKNRFL